MNNFEVDTKEGIDSQLVVRELQAGDIDKLRPIIETWVREKKTENDLGEIITEEVEEILGRMRGSLIESLDDISYHYLVAELSQMGLVGMIGYRQPPQGMINQFVKTEKPAEGINFFVARDIKGQGVGSRLNRALIAELRENGYTEFLFDSGPRYEKSGHPFHDSHYQRVGVIDNRYGKGYNASVWRIELQPPQPAPPVAPSGK